MGIKDRIKFIARSYYNAFMDSERPRRRPARHVDEEARPDELDFEAQWAAFQREEESRQARRETADGERSASGSPRSLRQCYENLGVPFGADWETSNKAYKRLMLRYHPDRQGGDQEKIVAATRASQILGESLQMIKQHLEREQERQRRR